MLKKIGPITSAAMSDIERARKTTTAPRTLTKRARPSTETILAALSNVLALYEQGLVQPKPTLSANGMTHVGETIANAQAVLSQSRWRERGPA